TRGYTPSVFALLPKLLERSGTSDRGSITALYTVLVDGDDMNEPIADAVRSILDGHIVLTRELAHAGHYPAVDVLQSVSRLVSEVTTPDVREAGMALRQLMAAYKDKADLIAIGAYERGTDPLVDRAIELKGEIDGFLRQGLDDSDPWQVVDQRLLELAGPPPVVDAEPVAPAAPEDAPRGTDPFSTGGPSALPPLNLAV
ncbi:MAG TPA: flagellum-specific ATP synthase FliI, partial [Capillimicrobium sp.]|nr:flagellum-specific ATP synthase FliI [Capillimicrobium sp.]